MVGKPYHQDSANNDGGGHNGEHVGKCHCTQDGVKGEHEVHDDDPEYDTADAAGLAVLLVTNFVNNQ